MVTLDQILDEAVKFNIISVINQNLFAINSEADEEDIEHFLVDILHYYSDYISILRNNNNTAIGLFIAK